MKIKVLTLNCWGLPNPISKFCNERMTAIGNELAKGDYDIVLLQEIWRQSDYDKLCDKLLPAFPHTHYFHSGVIGCGVCIFTKFPILETFQHRFSLNGFAHKVLHGDWYASKAVGVAKLLCDGMTINVYGTHLHADYCMIKDEYRVHRIVQAYEMSQFIKWTSEGCDAVIVGGDFNYMPVELGYKIIVTNGNLQDAWVVKREKSDDEVGATSNVPVNTFANPDDLKTHPNGKRIDYLLFRNNAGYDMLCDNCWVTMGEVPDKPYSYSDHKGVAAEFTIKRNITAMEPSRPISDLNNHLQEALPVIELGLKKVSIDKMFYIALMMMCIVVLFLTSEFTLPFGLGFLLALARTSITIAIGLFFWMGVIMSRQEMNALHAARKDMNNLHKASTIVGCR